MTQTWIPNFLRENPEPELPPASATVVLKEPPHVRWLQLHLGCEIGDRQRHVAITPAPSELNDGVRVVTLTVRAGQAWIRHDVEDLDTAPPCAVLRDGRVVFVSEGDGYREVKRSRAEGPVRRAKEKAHRDAYRRYRQQQSACGFHR